MRALLPAMFLALAATPAGARDLAALSTLLVPGYTAMSIAIMCGRGDPQFIAHNSGKRGTALHYAQHVKDELIEGLTHDEAVRVLTDAAETARNRARSILYRVGNASDAVQNTIGVRTYCAGEGGAFVRTTIEEHDSNHDAFLERMQRAKERTP